MAVMGNTEIAKFFSLKLLAQMNSNYAGMTNGCVLYKLHIQMLISFSHVQYGCHGSSGFSSA
jgi:hypothetical protein